MRTVVQLPPESHTNLRTYRGYRLEVRDCFHCWRDLHVYVPLGEIVGSVVTGVRCPHCDVWEAETLIPMTSQPIYVSACQRAWAEWKIRACARWLRTVRGHLRIWVTWPYWALYRFKLRWRRNQAER